MCDVKRQLQIFRDICARPDLELEKVLKHGKKAVGVVPYFCPEELVYAAGMIPFGLWGSQRLVSESKRYFPAFFCSILHTTLDMALKGELDGLSAVMIPYTCDSLKGMVSNWEQGVTQIPVIPVSYAQNRKIAAGVDYTTACFQKVRTKLEAIAGTTITDDQIRQAIAVYNENRKALLAFTEAAAAHPAEISPSDRNAVLKAGYFMDRADHSRMVQALTEVLNAVEPAPWRGIRVVTTGILADAPELLDILADNGISIAADQVVHESVGLHNLTPDGADPIRSMAERLSELEGSSLLFDPSKKRGRQLAELVKETKADGVIWIMTKFCDPEEFDYVPVKQMLDEADIPLLAVEMDQQMGNFAQARSAVEAFREVLE